jgi:hypothetical protein
LCGAIGRSSDAGGSVRTLLKKRLLNVVALALASSIGEKSQLHSLITADPWFARYPVDVIW